MDALEGTLIAAVEMRFAGRSYRPGDRFDWKRIISADQRRVRQMIAARRLAPLSRESMAKAMRVRPKDVHGVPYGFTVDGLLAMGIVEREDAEKYGWLNVDPEAPASEETPEAPETGYKPPADAVQVETLWLVPIAAGKRKVWDIYNAEGKRLNAGGTIANKSLAMVEAQKFLKAKPAPEPTPEPAPDPEAPASEETPEAEEDTEAMDARAIAAAMSDDELKANLGDAYEEGMDREAMIELAAKALEPDAPAEEGDGGDGGGELQPNAGD